MTWTAFHRRGDVLRAVTDTAAERGDGILPTDVPGVQQTFADETDLLGAIQMRWYTRLSGRIERELSGEPLDPEAAVIAGWRQTAADLPGARAILDHYREEPGDERAAEVMHRAMHKEHVMLAVLAGRGGASAVETARQGRVLEEKARTAPAAAHPGETSDAEATAPVGAGAGHGRSVLGRLRAALA